MKTIRIVALALVAIVCLLPGCNWRTSHSTRVGAYTAPSSLTVPAWWVDPQNTTGCASDSNTGQSATCAGGNNGPLKTWYALNSGYWNCTGQLGCPRLPQPTTVTFLSSHTDNTDPVYARPAYEQGGYLVIAGPIGSPQLVCSGTLGTVTPKVRTKGSATTLSAASLTGGCVGGVTTGNFVQNSTHPSNAWVYSGTTAPVFTQPLTAVTVPSTYFALPTEVDTWATGDTISVYNEVAVNLADITPVANDLNAASATNPWVYLYHVRSLDPSPTGETLHMNETVRPMESNIGRQVTVSGFYSGVPVAWVNDYFAAGVNAQSSTLIYAQGGAFKAGAAGEIGLDYDIYLGGFSTIFSSNGNGINLGTAYIDTSKTLFVESPLTNLKGTTAFSGSAILWGPGGMSVNAGGRLTLTAGAGQAATAIQLNGTLNINNQTLFCQFFPGSTTITCNNTFSAANIDTSLGATTGCVVGGGASLCNYGP